jgi:signal transduction histidine kinase
MTGLCPAPYSVRVSSSTRTSATLAPLERQRARQRAILGWLGPLRIAFVVVALAAGASVRPGPGLHGERLLVLLALAGFATGTLGLIGWRGRRRPVAVEWALSGVLLASAAVLVWLQPDGPGFLGIVVVAVTLVTRDPWGRVGGAVAAVLLLVLAAVRAVASGRPLLPVALSGLSVLAFSLVALLVRRLREGQEQAERLLVELERTREAEARAAVLGERQRLAREMHDVLAHSLSGLVLQLEGARLLAGERSVDPRLAETIDRAHHLARAGLDEARRAIATLRDEQPPVPERLAELARGLEEDLGVPCAFAISGEPRELEPEARLTLYRVGQEALTNIRKHAHPTRVVVRLGFERGGTRLVVEDFGASGPRASGAQSASAQSAGAQPAGPSPAGGGYGLTGMRERAELLGGSLVAAPTGSGFRVELWVPG